MSAGTPVRIPSTASSNMLLIVVVSFRDRGESGPKGPVAVKNPVRHGRTRQLTRTSA